MPRNGNDDARADTDEIARYRQAAEETLSQVDWCVNYFYRLRHIRIARAIEKNSAVIRREMRRTE